MSFYIFWRGCCVWNSTIFSMCLLFAAFIPRLRLNLTRLQDAGVFGSVSSLYDVNQVSNIAEPEFLAWEHFYFFYCGDQISADVNIEQTVCRLQWLQMPTKKKQTPIHPAFFFRQMLLPKTTSEGHNEATMQLRPMWIKHYITVLSTKHKCYYQFTM